MTKLTSFDVLIVYTEKMAASASDNSVANATPFPRHSRNESYNTVYAYFLEICQNFNLTAAFTTSADIIGPGFCRSFWKYADGHWSKVNSPCFSPLIFDKFSPIRRGIKSRRQLLFSGSNIKPFNDPDLFNIFFDKQLTYQKLASYSIPTVAVNDQTLKSIDTACAALTALLATHPGSADFSPDIIMKDRFGAGGRHVYKFKTDQSPNMLAVIKKNRRISYIIQPFAKFDHGFSYHHHPASTDIRLIYLNGNIVQSYIRVAKPGDFRCNEHQGGQLTYLSLSEIPPALIARSNLIAGLLDNKCSLFSLDFIISNSGRAYLLEGNTGPGLDWNLSLIQNEIEAKKLIRLIVGEIAIRTNYLN